MSTRIHDGKTLGSIFFQASLDALFLARAQSQKGFFGHILGQGADRVLALRPARLLAYPLLQMYETLPRRLFGGIGSSELPVYHHVRAEQFLQHP